MLLGEAGKFLSIISLSISFFLCFIFYFRSKENTNSRYLSYILGVYSIVFWVRTSFFLSWEGIIYLPFLFLPALFYLGPFIYSYFFSGIQKEEIAVFKYLPYNILPFLTTIGFAISFLLIDDFQKPANVLQQTFIVSMFTMSFIFIVSLHQLYFLFKSHKLLLNYLNNYPKYFASINKSYNWFYQFLFFNYSFVFIYLVLFFLQLFHIWKIPISLFEIILDTLFLYLILYNLIQRPESFVLKIPISEPEKNSKYSKQSITSSDKKRYLHKIKDYMEKEKPYLFDEISLQELSDKLLIPVHHLSITINSELNQNFFQFISLYRVEEAKKMLSDTDRKDDTILNIAFASGFSSKASFNKAFKEITGLTPSEYRKKHQKL
ncbi:MAG: AraC family transcriptional regulator [Leptospiraceae bacterium]|nr:AraC family transcriptional regulator [Leptospiraceae bacterium]